MFSVTGAIAVIVHVILLIYSIRAVKNFGKGLHQILFPKGKKSANNIQDEEVVYAGITDDDDNDNASDAGQIGAGLDEDVSINDVLRNTYSVTPSH